MDRRGGEVDAEPIMAMALDTLAYARRLREAGFSEQQAEGQAEALAAAMTDTLATKQDLQEMESRQGTRFSEIDLRFAQVDARFDRVDARFAQVDARFDRVDARFDELERRMDSRFVELEKRLEIRLDEQEKRTEIRFREHTALFRGELADLERRMTMRLGGIMVAGIGVMSALDRLI